MPGVCLFVSLFVCLSVSKTLRENYWTDFHEKFTIYVPLNEEKVIKSSASRCKSGNFWRILQHFIWTGFALAEVWALQVVLFLVSCDNICDITACLSQLPKDVPIHALLSTSAFLLYTVNHKKRDILFLTITLANLRRFL